jgi:hypothetical protein
VNQYRAEIGLTRTGKRSPWRELSVRLGYEVLEGDSGISLATPLAKVHAFQGWVDRFIGLPRACVEDLYLGGDITLPGKIRLVALYHEFAFKAVDGQYGEEVDPQATEKSAGSRSPSSTRATSAARKAPQGCWAETRRSPGFR